MIFSDIMDFTAFQNQSEYIENLTNNTSCNGANVTRNHPPVLTYIEITQLTVVSFGIPCNILILFITSKYLAHRFSRYNILLLFLALSDITYLLSFFTTMNGIFGNIGFEGNVFNCSIIYFFNFFSGFLSSWLIVLISFERFLCVRFPIKSHLYEGKVLIFVVLIIMSLIMAGFSSLAFRLSSIDPETKYCTYGEMSKTYFLNIVIAIGMGSFYIGIPGVLVFVFNVAILHFLRKHISNRNKCISKSDTIVSSAPLHDTRSVTVMLVATGFMFVILRTPFFLLDLMSILCQNSAIHPTWFSVTITTDLFDHSVNLLVYFASSSVFRTKVKDAMCCRNNP